MDTKEMTTNELLAHLGYTKERIFSHRCRVNILKDGEVVFVAGNVFEVNDWLKSRHPELTAAKGNSWVVIETK
jgi:hypothetical protein